MVSYKKYLDIEIFEGELSKHQYPWHFHNSYTIIIVEKGSITYDLQETQIKVGEAEAFIIAPFKVHKNSISEHTIYKAVFVPSEYLELAGQNKLGTRKLSHKMVSEGITDLLVKLEQNHSRRDVNDFVSRLCELINCVKSDDRAVSPAGISRVPKIDYSLPIKFLAEDAHLSRFYFQRKFKKDCGLTIGQLKQQEKSMKAKALLETGKSPTDVAYELGFFDQSHFIKYFKKMWVVTPKYFKK